MVAVGAGPGLEERGGRAQGDVGVDGEVEHGRDEAVGAEHCVAGADVVVAGDLDPAARQRKSQLLVLLDTELVRSIAIIRQTYLSTIMTMRKEAEAKSAPGSACLM